MDFIMFCETMAVRVTTVFLRGVQWEAKLVIIERRQVIGVHILNLEAGTYRF